MAYLKDKFGEMVRLALLLDEMVFIVSHKRLIRYNADRAIFHRYLIKLAACESGKCDICNEYNLNKFTYLFDGTGQFTKDFLNEWSKLQEFVTVKENIKELFKMRD